jgi:hypothetical protein
MAWWEYLVVFGIPILTIAISKITVEKSATYDREFWNSYLTCAEYIEPWSTWDDETCYREVCEETCSGSGEDRTCTQTCHTESYDCSHCDRYSATWSATDNLGRTYSISQYLFEDLCKRWNRRVFVDMNRNIDHHFGCGQDGDAYQTVFDNVFEHTQSVCVVHSYENRVQASHSVFKFQPVEADDVKKLELHGYNYNYDIFNYNPIMGISDHAASKRLSWWNAKLGAMKKVHMLILVFTDKAREAGELQEAYWCGGNKNEFVLCIGIDSKRMVQWTKVFSWSESDRLKLDVERTIYMMFSDSGGKALNLSAVVDTMANMVKVGFVKKSFKDFSYLSVEPSGKAVLITFIITIIVTLGASIFCVMNDIDQDY